MPDLHVLRVFVNDEGEWGNPLGVFLDGAALAGEERQEVAAELGFSETVFVDDRERGEIRIHTPTLELAFAGHPVVGTAWLLARTGAAPGMLRPPAGEVSVRIEGRTAHATAGPHLAPPFERRRLSTPADVHALDPGAASGNTYAWSWIDEAAGTVRARCFAPAAGIAEDEATGSAALALCAEVGRPLTVHQGHGSVIACRPLPDGQVEIGGDVVLDRVRAFG